jgi:hypothetical protein
VLESVWLGIFILLSNFKEGESMGWAHDKLNADGVGVVMPQEFGAGLYIQT